MFFPDLRIHKKGLYRLSMLYVFPIALFCAWRGWFFTFPAYARNDPDIGALMHLHQGLGQYLQNTQWIMHFVRDVFFGEMLTPLGGLLVVVGFVLAYANIRQDKQFRLVLPAWFVASAALTVVVAHGSRTQDYYLLHWIPFCAIFVGVALEYVADIIRKTWIRQTVLMSVSAIIMAAILYYLWMLPFRYFVGQYLVNNTYHSDQMLSDYDHIQRIVPTESEVLVLLPYIETYPLNMIKRFGFNHELPRDECFDYEGFAQEILPYYKSIGVGYIMLFTVNEQHDGCDRKVYMDYMKLLGLPLLYAGNNFNLYSFE